MRCMTYKCILIFIIIKCVKSQDNDPDQPADDEDEDNFDVLDLDKIIQERISRFDDPQYQPQYQQIQEYQYPTQPQTQPQQYDYYQGESQELSVYQPQYYQSQSLQYQPQSHSEQYDQYQGESLQYQPQTHSEQYDQYQGESFYYQPELQQYQPQQVQYGQYVSYHPTTAPQTSQPTQQSEQYYQPSQPYQPQQPSIPELTQPSYQNYEVSQVIQQSEQYYQPSQPQQPQQPDQYYDPYHPTQQQQSYQYYLSPSAPQPQHQYYEVSQPTQQQQYYEPPQPAQPSYQYYLPPPPQSPTQPQYQYYLSPPQQQPQPVTQSPQPQSETVEDDDNFYVTEHDQPQQEPSVTETGFIYGPTQPATQPAIPPTQYLTPPQEHVAEEPTQQSIQPQKKPGKRKRTRATSGEEDEEEEEEPVKLKKPRPIKKSKNINFYKRNYLGNLEEMDEGEYVVIYGDKKKKDYEFNTNLEQLEFNNEVIYEHINGTSYCSLLSHSKETDVFILTSSQGFTLVKKSSGIWTRTDHVIPNYVKLFTQDSGGNEILLTEGDYDIDFTSSGSFRYILGPGVKCCKIVAEGLTVWEKTEKDDGYPIMIYLSIKRIIIVKFEKYSKTFRKRVKKFILLYTRKFCKKT